MVKYNVTVRDINDWTDNSVLDHSPLVQARGCVQACGVELWRIDNILWYIKNMITQRDFNIAVQSQKDNDCLLAK